ncbi:acyl-CoA thioester hydrolase/BAAT C-terminal domain-containing protein [Brevundimonas goettingensis]|uniref:Alpha/beta hydrolase n=1 Tax=Brevundimonas goettingensis TaxID=2774190 RepID=A0A975C253_9CAUL|nr:acyl-CoA thioester hydrolase/BAAT C-terminal domain-containing protein [Brevundimonas goettingensis]QTC90172.1 alpha/beta hydrolase [Brevundimonas goettingensis]
MPNALPVASFVSASAVLFGAFVPTGTVAAAQTPPATQQAAAPAVRLATQVIREEGLVAEYFAPVAASRASAGAVIVLGGSEGGLSGSRGLARHLADEGFAAIAVSYFGEPGQQAKLDQVPIEPVGRALAWLKARTDIRGPIAIMGISKGAELALLIASREPRIGAVVVGVPSSVVWAGIDMAGGPVGSSWTANGQPLPYVHYDLSKGFTGVFNLYNDSLTAAPAEARIPVENIHGPVMMISGQADSLWPSSRMAAEVEERLNDHQFAWPVVSIAYPDAGHAAFGIPVAADAPGLERATYLGGTVPGLVAARADGWPRVLAFLRTALNP